MSRYRRWQERHDQKLTKRYSGLPSPLRAISDLYPSQQRQKQRDSGRRDRITQPTTPPPGWVRQPTPTYPPPLPGTFAAPAARPVAPSLAEELNELAELRRREVITQEDFEAAKRQLLQQSRDG